MYGWWIQTLPRDWHNICHIMVETGLHSFWSSIYSNVFAREYNFGDHHLHWNWSFFNPTSPINIYLESKYPLLNDLSLGLKKWRLLFFRPERRTFTGYGYIYLEIECVMWFNWFICTVWGLCWYHLSSKHTLWWSRWRNSDKVAQ